MLYLKIENQNSIQKKKENRKNSNQSVKSYKVVN